MALVSPVVVGPVSPCSSSVRVRGQFAGATIQVLGTTPGGTRTVAKAIAQAADEWIPLLPGITLKSKEMLTADQRTSSDYGKAVPVDNGVEVGATPGAGDLSEIFSAETMLECGTCLWVAGICPGAEVTFRRNGEPPLVARSPADQLKFVLPSGHSLRPSDVLTVSQAACGVGGSSVSLAAPVPQFREAWPVAGPVVALPLVRCQTHLSLTGVLPGATVVVGLNGAEYRACFGATRGVFWLPHALKIGDNVQVRQEFGLCELTSRTTESDVADDLPPPPSVIGPICEGDRLVRIDGLFEGAVVELALDEVPFCSGVAALAACEFGVPSLQGASTLAARQSVCGGAPGTWSDWSEGVDIVPLDPQVAPAIVGPLVERGTCVRVTTAPWPAATPLPLPKGTLVQVVSRKRGVLGEAWTNGDMFVDVALWFPLLRTDRVRLRTRRCGHRREWPNETVVGLPRDMMPPTIFDPACDCGGSVLVRDIVPGAIVEIFRKRGAQVPVLLGSGRSGGDWASIDVAPLASGDQVHGRQRMGPVISGPSAVAMAPDTPRWHYRDRSAFRLCQLTQDWDPTGRPHAGPTTPIGIAGTDLGIPVEHVGRLYLFFGDAAKAPGIATDADPIAWVTTTDPDDLETHAPDLRWILGSDGKFRRLALIDGPELGNFEVPTGAFSYDGRLYVFVATDRREDPILRMTASRLAVASDPAHDFQSILFISSTVGGQLPVLNADGSVSGVPYPGGRWMLNISPTVVRNADWPGLPSTTGDGLLLYGTSLYRGDPSSDRTATEQGSGNVYLAWAPLTPGAVPPASPIPSPANWSFLVGRKPTGEPDWGTLAGGAKPMPILPPDPWGPRFLGEISVVWYPELRRWILAGSAPFATVNVARNPWGPWTTSQNLCDAADPNRDAGNSHVGGLWNETNVSYAPYLVRRWLKWDRSIRMATVYFTLSVYDLPHDQYRYQPQLMRSSIQCGL